MKDKKKKKLLFNHNGFCCLIFSIHSLIRVISCLGTLSYWDIKGTDVILLAPRKRLLYMKGDKKKKKERTVSFLEIKFCL